MTIDRVALCLLHEAYYPRLATVLAPHDDTRSGPHRAPDRRDDAECVGRTRVAGWSHIRVCLDHGSRVRSRATACTAQTSAPSVRRRACASYCSQHRSRYRFCTRLRAAALGLFAASAAFSRRARGRPLCLHRALVSAHRGYHERVVRAGERVTFPGGDLYAQRHRRDTKGPLRPPFGRIDACQPSGLSNTIVQ
jgi:hypothetical protein